MNSLRSGNSCHLPRDPFFLSNLNSNRTLTVAVKRAPDRLKTANPESVPNKSNFDASFRPSITC